MSAGLSRSSPPLRRLLLHRWLEGRAPAVASRASVLAVESLLGVPGLGGALAGGRLVCAQGVRPSSGSSTARRERRLRYPARVALPDAR